MKVFALWYGGSGYAMPDPFTDVEEFASIQHAFNEMDGRFYDPYYPCIEEVPPEEGGHYMHLFRGNPLAQDLMPDYILQYTKRGTLKCQKEAA